MTLLNSNQIKVIKIKFLKIHNKKAQLKFNKLIANLKLINKAKIISKKISQIKTFKKIQLNHNQIEHRVIYKT